MEIIKRKILLESSRYRQSGTTIANCDVKVDTIDFGDYELLTATGGGEVKQVERGELKNCVFYLPIFLSQKYDDIGIYTPMEFIPAQPLTNIPDNLDSAVRPSGVTADMYYGPSSVITGTTDDSQLLSVTHPQTNLPYQPYVNLAEDTHIRFDGVIAHQPNVSVTYVIGGDVTNSGNPNGPHNYIPNGNGITYTTYLNQLIDNIDPVTGDNNEYRRTTFSFNSNGRNEYNTSLSALTKEEEFLGVVFPQEVQSDVFINRGAEDIFEKHMVMAEIKTVNDIDDYRGGYLVNVID